METSYEDVPQDPAAILATLAEDNPLRVATTGELIKELTQIRDDKRELNKRLKELNEEWRTVEALLMLRLDAQGMKRASTDDGTATITTDEVPLVRDWDEALKFMREQDQMHFLQRRIATAAWKEFRKAGYELPGVDVYNKREISLRKS